MTDPVTANKQLWESWAKAHVHSDFYDVEGFKKGETSLRHIELEEIGDISGLSLLHLQCHFGLDTLSLARLGARVTGVDISENAIKTARSLAEELRLDARFVQTELMDLPQHLDGTFDRVFTSYGALCWLADLNAWAQLIHRYLKSGGVFYMVEFHPMMDTLDDKGQFEYPYFASDKPWAEDDISYASPEQEDTAGTSYTWSHHLGEVVTSLVQAGLQLEFLHEFPYTPYELRGFQEEAGEQRFAVRKDVRHPSGGLPLTYSIRAYKP